MIPLLEQYQSSLKLVMSYSLIERNTCEHVCFIQLISENFMKKL